MGQFGWPSDVVAQVVFGLALISTYVALRAALSRQIREHLERHFRLTLTLLCALSALLSLGYVFYYLRGGPRIIDATAYLLQARGFANGHLTLPVLDPSASLRGRFLYYSPEHARLSVLFPPGYAAALALSVFLGTPWLLGIALAALLTWMTALVTLRLFDDKLAALFAAVLCTSNACLRYHTADTMSHGLSALLILIAVYGVLGTRRYDALLTGLSLGWLFATRPVTALGTGTVLFLGLLLNRQRARSLGFVALGFLPGALFWLTYQWVTTGSLVTSTQHAYYAVADGPPNCFRYGLGRGIGCLFEHGSYVEKRLPHGYGFWQSLYVTLLRLRWHALDVLNVELLFPVVILALYFAARRATTRLLTAVVVIHILAYLPFYFDGSYPGGGARFFADIIPLELCLVAGLFVHHRLSLWVFPLSLFGFALHGAFEHLQLRHRDGGRPMFEANVLKAQGITRGLVFVDTDHGFLLGHEPRTTTQKSDLVVARHHGDAHDRLLWEHLGRPSAYHYQFNPAVNGARAQVKPIFANELSKLAGFEAEAAWPPLTVNHGWVLPVYPPNDCTSGLRGLSLEPVKGRAKATLALPVEERGVYRLRVHWVARRGGLQEITLHVGPHQRDVRRDALTHQCFETVHTDLLLLPGETPLSIETSAQGIVIDRYQLEK